MVKGVVGQTVSASSVSTRRTADDDPRWRSPDQAHGFHAERRMGPPPRSLAPDAYACIMVEIPGDPPNTRLWRGPAPDRELPSDRSRITASSPANTMRPRAVATDLAEAGAVLAAVNTAARRLWRWPSASVDRRRARRSSVDGGAPDRSTIGRAVPHSGPAIARLPRNQTEAAKSLAASAATESTPA